MEENNIKKESTIDDVLKAISESSDEIQKQFEGVNGRLDAVEHRLDNIDSNLIEVEERLTKVETNLKGVKASVEKTADILEQKQIINITERQQIYHAADPFALPA